MHGKNHVGAGSFGAHVRWLVLMDPQGSPQRLSPPLDARFWATVGGMGLTGPILVVALQLRPIGTAPASVRRVRAASLEGAARNELAARLKHGAVVVLDVRPAAEFEAGHIPGARSVPVAELRRLRSLPKGIEIVAYCRGPYCVYADDAVRQLRRRGFNAVRLEDGYPEWKRAGLPVTVGSGG